MDNWKDLIRKEDDFYPIEYKWKKDIRQKKAMLMKTIALIQNLYNDANREKDAKLAELYKTTQDGLMRAMERLKA